MDNQNLTNGCVPAKPQRMAIRFLFLAFILGALASWVIREGFGEPYPGPFMPAFKGNGLHMLSPTVGEVTLPRITVVFSDQSSVKVSVSRLFGDGPDSARRPMLMLIAPDPDLTESTSAVKGKLQRWMTKFVPQFHETTPNTTWTIPDDVREYLQRRLVKLYPSKTALNLTIAIDRYQFSLADFHKPTITLVSQNTITFHEGS